MPRPVTKTTRTDRRGVLHHAEPMLPHFPAATGQAQAVHGWCLSWLRPGLALVRMGLRWPLASYNRAGPGKKAPGNLTPYFSNKKMSSKKIRS